ANGRALKQVDDASATVRAAQHDPAAAVRPLQMPFGRSLCRHLRPTESAWIVREIRPWCRVEHRLSPTRLDRGASTGSNLPPRRIATQPVEQSQNPARPCGLL